MPKLSADPDLVGQLVNEALRWPPPHATRRLTARELRLGEISVPENAQIQLVLASGNREEAVFEDGERLLHELQGQRFDLVFTDIWPGKFYALDACLNLLARGALYVVDDLLPQSNWPEGHAPKVASLIPTLENRADLLSVRRSWVSGLIFATKRQVGTFTSDANPTQKKKPRLDRQRYARRYRVEVFFHDLKRFRAIAIRFEKTAQNYLALLQIACSMIWLQDLVEGA